MNKASGYTLKKQVYEALLSDITTGVYLPDVVLTEKSLMEKYGTSRAPIREALMQLTGKHILSSIPRQGYKIVRLNEQQLQEIVKFRSALECSFLEGNSNAVDEASIQELREACERYTNSPSDDFMLHWNYNCEFHLKLFSIYRNQYAYKLLEDALSMQTIYFVQKKHFATMDLHLLLVDYLEKGEIKPAIAILKADIENLLYSSSGRL